MWICWMTWRWRGQFGNFNKNIWRNGQSTVKVASNLCFFVQACKPDNCALAAPQRTKRMMRRPRVGHIPLNLAAISETTWVMWPVANPWHASLYIFQETHWTMSGNENQWDSNKKILLVSFCLKVVFFRKGK